MRRLSTIKTSVLHAAADLEMLAAVHEADAAKAAALEPGWRRDEAPAMRAEAARLRSLAGDLSRVGYGL